MWAKPRLMLVKKEESLSFICPRSEGDWRLFINSTSPSINSKTSLRMSSYGESSRILCIFYSEIINENSLSCNNAFFSQISTELYSMSIADLRWERVIAWSKCCLTMDSYSPGRVWEFIFICCKNDHSLEFVSYYILCSRNQRHKHV